MKKFKNDKERIAFLEDYRNQDHGWRLWKNDIDLERKLWRLDLEDVSLVVEEQLQTIQWPTAHQKWIVKNWFILDSSGRPFADGTASRTQALAVLKEAGKKK